MVFVHQKLKLLNFLVDFILSILNKQVIRRNKNSNLNFLHSLLYFEGPATRAWVINQKEKKGEGVQIIFRSSNFANILSQL